MGLYWAYSLIYLINGGHLDRIADALLSLRNKCLWTLNASVLEDICEEMASSIWVGKASWNGEVRLSVSWTSHLVLIRHLWHSKAEAKGSRVNRCVGVECKTPQIFLEIAGC